jgi:light-harvesting protein B-800-850 alpha chain
MNQGRIWCVVSPTVGLPLLLGSVALTSLAIHTAVLTHTTWYANSYQGSAKRLAMNTAAPAAELTSRAQPAFVITVAPATGAAGKAETSFVVTVSPSAQGTVQAQQAPSPASVHPVALAQAK